ncbi:hypothetical protein BV20DRAFT_133185 [Pilatotrama ljubarskyi]|nr:hypothetical protein BV20DRAFT_133185 [Pilatotrama ljubarskyi]
MEKSYRAMGRWRDTFWGANGGWLPCYLGVAIVGTGLRLVLDIGWRDVGNELTRRSAASTALGFDTRAAMGRYWCTTDLTSICQPQAAFPFHPRVQDTLKRRHLRWAVDKV